MLDSSRHLFNFVGNRTIFYLICVIANVKFINFEDSCHGDHSRNRTIYQ